MNLTLVIIIVVISLLLQAFFAGIEIGIISISKIRLLRKIRKGSVSAKIVRKLLSNPEKLLGTTLVGTNISIVVSSTLVTTLIYEYYPKYAEYLSLFILTPLILILCEAIPKVIFREYRDSLTINLSPVLDLFYFIFYPIVILVTFISKGLILLIGRENVTRNPYITREELQIIALESYRGKEDEALRKIARRIFHFGEKNAKSIMLEINDVIVLEKTQTVKELKEIFKQTKYSKYPVYSRKKENLIGFINIKDILGVGENKRISGFVKKAQSVTPEMGLEALLTIFKKGGEQMIFVKRKGEHAGIITLEDVLEELVGEIKDEYELK